MRIDDDEEIKTVTCAWCKCDRQYDSVGPLPHECRREMAAHHPRISWKIAPKEGEDEA